MITFFYILEYIDKIYNTFYRCYKNPIMKGNIKSDKQYKTSGRYLAFNVIIFVITILFLNVCSSTSEKEKMRKVTRFVELFDFNITLSIPKKWDVSFSNGRFYPLIVTGFGPNGYPTVIEYRGLVMNLRDYSSKALFAAGWYRAPLSNYPTWKYVMKRRIPSDPDGYEFEGKYKKNNTVYLRIGKLRFRGNRVHGLFYTTPEKSVSKMRKFFNTIDSLHKYSINKKPPS